MPSPPANGSRRTCLSAHLLVLRYRSGCYLAFFIVGFAGEDDLDAPDTETGAPNIRLGFKMFGSTRLTSTT
jgi:hypothetical protein